MIYYSEFETDSIWVMLREQYVFEKRNLENSSLYIC